MDDDRKGFLQQIKQLVNSKSEKPRYRKLLLYAATVLMFGIALMVFGGFNKEPSNQSAPAINLSESSASNEAEPAFGQDKSSEPNTMTEYERNYENELKDTLQGIVGVDNVTVMVNLEATESKVFVKNEVNQIQKTEETDKQGGERIVEDQTNESSLVILREGDKEKPVIVKTVKPEIRGVLIVAGGAENIKVKQMIVEAVTRVLDVPVHKISVLPKKIEEES